MWEDNWKLLLVMTDCDFVWHTVGFKEASTSAATGKTCVCPLQLPKDLSLSAQVKWLSVFMVMPLLGRSLSEMVL